MNSETGNALLSAVDALRSMLRSIERDKSESDVSYAELVSLLNSIGSGESAEHSQEIDIVWNHAELNKDGESSRSLAYRDAEGVVKHESNGSSEVAESTIRVQVSHLDKVINLVGELVLSRNQLLQVSAELRNPHLQNASHQLNMITSELQENILKIRMQPINVVWKKLPRIVRDLSNTCGKLVTVKLEGENTELDKSIIEAIKDPLTHIVRNSIDHGIELPEERVRQGKPQQGVLSLNAFHEGGYVNIEISDDGRGLNLDKILNKALEKHLVSEANAKELSAHQIAELIFHPGFSTADRVTNVSGRGVGMDVVKTNIEKIDGSVTVRSEPGKWTRITIRIPLTLAILPALIIRSAGLTYAIPQNSVVELILVKDELIANKIKIIQGVHFYRLRNKLLPLVMLREVLKDEGALDCGAVSIVVVSSNGAEFGLAVDKIYDTQEIVVKPLGQRLNTIPVYSGATVMGDGDIALILDIHGLAEVSKISNTAVRSLTSENETRSSNKNQSTLLLVETANHGRAAICLKDVVRLEKVLPSQVEHVGNKLVVQYRGEILPLIYLDQLLQSSAMSFDDIATSATESLQVVVCNCGDSPIGVVVSKIVDITSEVISSLEQPTRRGVKGQFIAHRRVTEMIDLRLLLSSAYEPIKASA